MLSVLKMSLPLNQQYIEIDLKNLQEPNWNEVTEEQKLDLYKSWMMLINAEFFVILYLAGYYCCYTVFKKMKCNS